MRICLSLLVVSFVSVFLGGCPPTAETLGADDLAGRWQVTYADAPMAECVLFVDGVVVQFDRPCDGLPEALIPGTTTTSGQRAIVQFGYSETDNFSVAVVYDLTRQADGTFVGTSNLTSGGFSLGEFNVVMVPIE